MGRRFDPDRAHLPKILEMVENVNRLIMPVLALSAFVVSMIINYGKYIQGDFSIYFSAGKRLSEDLNLYQNESTPYVYGPLLAHLLSPFSGLNELLASRTWLILSVLAVSLSAWIICQVLLPIVYPEHILFAMTILSISFALRNNLGNGNVMAFVLLGLVMSIKLALKKENTKNAIYTALITFFIFEVKTYMALYLILFLLICKRIKSSVLTLAFMCVSNLLYFFTSQTSYIDWLRALKLRSSGLQNGSDQATILVFLNKLPFDSNLIYLVSVCIVYFFLLAWMFRGITINKAEKRIQGLIIFAAAPIITVFSHGQDFLISTLVLVALILRPRREVESFRRSNNYLVLALGLVVNWTNEQVFYSFLALALYGLVLLIMDLSKRIILLVLVINGLSTVILNSLLKAPGDLQYLTYNFQALVFGLLCFFAITKRDSLKLVIDTSYR